MRRGRGRGRYNGRKEKRGPRGGPAPGRARDGEERGVTEKKLIAVCDDEAAIADLVAQLLAQGGFEARTFYALSLIHIWACTSPTTRWARS